MNNPSPVDLLKTILVNLNSPQDLSDHPWAVSAQVDGERLGKITIAMFRRMIPPSPPREGKRLDTRWGVFGILAAQYFAPSLLQTPPPTSLRDAWDSIDRSILLFIFEQNEEITDEKKSPYRFTENERMPAPNSTLGDWHRRGMEQLAALMQSECEKKQPVLQKAWLPKSAVRNIALAFSAILLLVLFFFGWKGWELYQRVQVIEQKAIVLQQLITPEMGIEQAPEIVSQVHDLRVELDTLHSKAAPYLWLTKYGGWIPKYGGTLQQAEDLLIFSQSLIAAADDGLSAISPAVEAASNNDQPLEVLDLLIQLKDSSPKLLSAQIALAGAQAARERIQTDILLPRLRDIITQKVDPLFSSISGNFPMEDALTMVSAAPDLLGGGKAGPQTYLILMQNEDELRPTGGFLTAIGLAVVKDGKLLSINIDSSDSSKIDDFNEPYPIPPWQFEEFMNIKMFLLRDSNWFTDFPTTASWAEYFYSYSRGASADGVITLDMNVIAQLLKTLGPVQVDSVNTPISSENVQDYLRSAEQAPPKGINSKEWDRKQFIADLAQPILEKVLNARGKTWNDLVPVLLSLLDEKHILLQFDNEDMAALIERRNWDGAVRIPENSDFLMVVDTNMGYNKSNAVMKMALDYVVDLTLPTQPGSLLTVQQINQSNMEIPCEPFAAERFSLGEVVAPGEIPDPLYTTNACHWGYLRVYLPKGTQLLRSNPQEIIDTATMLGKTIPARVDDLGNEDIPGAQVFGTMVITPTQQSSRSEFEYDLPAGVVTEESSELLYRLKVQKQPGTLAHSFDLTLLMPASARIKSANIPLVENAGAWRAKLDLQQDLMIEVRFTTEE